MEGSGTVSQGNLAYCGRLMTSNVVKKMPPLVLLIALHPLFQSGSYRIILTTLFPPHPYPMTVCARSLFPVLLITPTADPVTDSQWPGHAHRFLNSPWKHSHLSCCFCFCCSSLALSRLGKNPTYSSKSFANVPFSANIPDRTQN